MDLPEQKRIIGMYREAIRLYDLDRAEAVFLYRQAYSATGLFRTKAFNALEQDILMLWRTFTPQPKGRYQTTHIAIGYSARAVQRWVNDTVQPPRAGVAELLARFDGLVIPWTFSVVEKLILLEKDGEHSSAECAGYETCEDRGFSGGDEDDVWFYYHKGCYGQFVESAPRWTVELSRSLSYAEALSEEYICERCGKFLCL